MSRDSRLTRTGGKSPGKDDIEDAVFYEIDDEAGQARQSRPIKQVGPIRAWWRKQTRLGKVGVFALGLIILLFVGFLPAPGGQQSVSPTAAPTDVASDTPALDQPAETTIDPETRELATLSQALTGNTDARKFSMSNDTPSDDTMAACATQGGSAFWFFGWFNSDHPNSFAMVTTNDVSFGGRFHFHNGTLSLYDLYETDKQGAPLRPLHTSNVPLKIVPFKGGAFVGETAFSECDYEPDILIRTMQRAAADEDSQAVQIAPEAQPQADATP